MRGAVTFEGYLGFRMSIHEHWYGLKRTQMTLIRAEFSFKQGPLVWPWVRLGGRLRSIGTSVLWALVDCPEREIQLIELNHLVETGYK